MRSMIVFCTDLSLPMVIVGLCEYGHISRVSKDTANKASGAWYKIKFKPRRNINLAILQEWTLGVISQDPRPQTRISSATIEL